MKLFYAPGACSIGIHVLLEEIGKPYETQAVNLAAGEQLRPEFPSRKGKVPVLVREDGWVLTEFGAIARYLARTNPAARLLPEAAEAAARVDEMLDYVVGTVHGQGFARLFRPGRFNPADEEAARKQGREMVDQAFGLIARALDGREYVEGGFSIADAALFYVCFWAAGRAQIALPGPVGEHYARMRARAAVQRVLSAEGLA
jgi:glutathione S-transferase